MSWWSTTLWTARTTWRRRPGRSLKSGFITSLGFFSTWMWYAGVILVDIQVFLFAFNVWDNIKDMWVGCRRHCGQQGQLGGGYHEVAEIRMYHINRNFFFNLDVICFGDSGYISLTCWTTLRTWKLVVNDTVDGKDNLEEKTREVSKIRMYHLSWVFPHLGCDMLWWCWLTSIFSHISDNI